MPLVSCSPPTCYLTRPRKRPGRRTLPGRCMRPNPWIMFLIRMGGQGFDRKAVSDMYKKWKREFHAQNPTLSESEMKAKMNDHLCGDIARTSERNLARKSKRLKETRECRRKTAKKNTEARRKKAVEEAKAKEIARARQKKAAEEAEARDKAEANATANAKAKAKAKAAKASDATKAKAAKAKTKAAKEKDRKSTALGWDCVRPTTITSSKKERFNSCEKRPGGKYGSRRQCVENCYTTTYSADEILALKADDKAKRANGKGKGKANAKGKAKGKGKAIDIEPKTKAKRAVKAAEVRVTRGTSKKGRSDSNAELFFRRTACSERVESVQDSQEYEILRHQFWVGQVPDRCNFG